MWLVFHHYSIWLSKYPVSEPMLSFLYRILLSICKERICPFYYQYIMVNCLYSDMILCDSQGWQVHDVDGAVVNRWRNKMKWPFTADVTCVLSDLWRSFVESFCWCVFQTRAIVLWYTNCTTLKYLVTANCDTPAYSRVTFIIISQRNALFRNNATKYWNAVHLIDYRCLNHVH